ncbi:GspH/FimT family pseudopilin [Dyella flagellata]|nr:GspH/FimT family pseudopilin [Dyella flagellata]
MTKLRGFGLIEQIIALAVLAVLATIAIPAFRRLVVGYELRVAQSDYMAALQHARNLAVNEQVRTIFCPSRNALTCNLDNQWEGGWLIGRDPSGKQQVEGKPLYTGGRYSPSIRIVGSDKKHFWFKPDGGSAGTLQRLVLCTHERPPRIRVVRVAMQGRIRAAPPEREDVAKCPAGR